MGWCSGESSRLPLACSAGRILSVRVFTFVFGRHLGFGNCGELGRGKIGRGSRREVAKHPITIQDGDI